MESVINVEIRLPKQDLARVRLVLESALQTLEDKLPDECTLKIRMHNEGTLGELIKERQS